MTYSDEEPTFTQNALSGALAGVFTTAVMVPGERIKCLLQVCLLLYEFFVLAS